MMAVHDLELRLGQACRAKRNGVNLYFICVFDIKKDTWTTQGHLDKALAYVEADMCKRDLYQVACPSYASKIELGMIRNIK